MRRIKAKGGSFAHVLGKGTVEIRRSRQSFIIAGSDFQVFGTSPDPSEKMVVIVENGMLSEDGLEFRDDADLTDEERAELEARNLVQPNEEDTEAGALKPNSDSEEEEPEEPEE